MVQPLTDREATKTLDDIRVSDSDFNQVQSVVNISVEDISEKNYFSKPEPPKNKTPGQLYIEAKQAHINKIQKDYDKWKEWS